LRRRRVPFDAKAFRPHLTISRPGSRVPAEALEHDVAALEAYAGPEWTVAGMHLVASQLGPRPVYTTVHTVEFTSEAPPP
jgi:2'-5' RNA ligase